jgi:hypothetical protein
MAPTGQAPVIQKNVTTEPQFILVSFYGTHFK